MNRSYRAKSHTGRGGAGRPRRPANTLPLDIMAPHCPRRAGGAGSGSTQDRTAAAVSWAAGPRLPRTSARRRAVSRPPRTLRRRPDWSLRWSRGCRRCTRRMLARTQCRGGSGGASTRPLAPWCLWSIQANHRRGVRAGMTETAYREPAHPPRGRAATRRSMSACSGRCCSRGPQTSRAPGGRCSRSMQAGGGGAPD